MKHFNLLKTTLLLCALIVGSLSGWAEDIVVTLDNIGAGIGNSANTTANTTNITATGTTDSYALNYYQCKKQGNAMLMTKNVSPYISNHTAMPGNIKSVEVFINSGAAKATTYNCAFSTTECNTATSGIGAVNITGGNSHVFSNLSGETIKVNGKYFCVTLGNSNNGQVLKLVITCETSDPSDTRSDAGISFAETGIAKTWGESFTGLALSNPNSVDVTYSSTDESVATVSSTGVVTMVKAGSTTIKATFAGDATYKAAVASYDLTINKANANLSYDETVFDVDLNDNSFVAPTLNNPNGLSVTYSSNNEKIAIVDENTGELVLKTGVEGTVTITASFTGNDNYNAGSAKYTINIIDQNKKGSKLNPYTVAEVRNGDAAGKSNVWVKGYIVGSWKNNAFNSSDLVNSNLALADNYDSDTTIPVELTSGSGLRTDWGPSSNQYKVGVMQILVKGNGQDYFSSKAIKGASEIEAIAEAITVTSAGFSTYASDFGLDFSGLDVKVYKARVNGTTITFDKVTEVPAGEGVLLQGEGTFEVPVKSVDAWAADYNAFVRGTGAAVATGDGPYNYILNKVNGVVGFYKANDQTVAKNRAYLQSMTAATRISLNYDEETTGISEVVKSDVNNKVFDLQGRHIAQPTKGLYIMNGRKVLVK